MLALADRDNLRDWEQDVRALDWSHGVTKHDQMRSAFGMAANRDIPRDDAREFVIEQIEHAGGELCERDIERNLDFFYHSASDRSVRQFRKAEPGFDTDFSRNFASQIDLPDPVSFLKNVSPVAPDTVTSAQYLEAVYQPDDKILAFTDYNGQGEALYTVGISGPGGLPEGGPDGVWYLINPIDGKYHRNPRENKQSRRSQESVTDFRYALIESDEVPVEQWLRILVQLPLPIVAIYLSAGRSVHALVKVLAESKAHHDSIRARIRPMLLKLGSCKGSTMNSVHLSRLPQAYRGERCQELLYLNPHVGADHPQPIFTVTPAPHCSDLEEGGAQ